MTNADAAEYKRATDDLLELARAISLHQEVYLVTDDMESE